MKRALPFILAFIFLTTFPVLVSAEQSESLSLAEQAIQRIMSKAKASEENTDMSSEKSHEKYGIEASQHLDELPVTADGQLSDETEPDLSMRFLLFLPGIFFLVISWLLAIKSGSSNTSSDKNKLYNAEDKAGRYGLNASNPETVKKYIRNLESSYSSYGSSASSATRNCCNTTISDLYSHHDSLIEDRWYGKAWKYLDGLEADLTLLLGSELFTADIIDSTKTKNHILSQYDSYWKWTEKCANDCESQSGKARLWDQARDNMKSKLSSDCFDTGITTWWGVPANKSVREQLEKRLNDRLAELRPEYLRKKKLMKDMVAAVAAEETMLRADLMKLPFDAVSKNEISSVYRILVKTGRLFEMKVGSRYIVSLSDKERAKKERGQKKAASESANALNGNPARNVQDSKSVEPEKSPLAPHSSSNPAISGNTPPSPAADSSPVQKPASVPESAPVRESVEAVKEKADDFLTHFFANYFSIVLTDGSFSDVDNLPSLFSQCLQNYNSYNQLNLKERFGIDPLEYMKMFVGDRYEPCMSSRRELEMRLGGIATKLGPVKERREKLDSLLLRRLVEEKQIPVSELFHHPVDGYTLEEIDYCYNTLKKSGRIVEFHIKKDTYIRLPQAANGGMYNKKPRVAGSESSERRETPFTKTDLIAFLDSKSMEYVDKTPSGGCFWILGGPNADSFIKEVVVDGAKPVYAKNAKALNNRPGWFIKLGQPGKGPVNQAAYAAAQTQIH